MHEVDLLEKILALGGNGAAVAGVFLAWKIFQRFERIMDRHTKGLQAIREAIIASNPDTIEVFAQHDRKQNEKDLQDLSR
jgi:hypothetical protein